MSNRRREPVSYRPFRTQPLLADGLLPVARPGGELETQAGQAFFSLARRFGEDLDKKAEQDGPLAGEQSGLVSAPSIAVEGGSPGQEADAVAVAGSKGSNDRAGQAMAYFRSRGLSQHAAAGIVGNLMAESRLNTAARNKGDGSDGSDSIGIGQWNGDRARALQSFAQNAGKAPTDFETQLAFVLHELDGSEKSAGQKLRSARTVEEATAAMIGYERPAGWSDANPRGGHNWSGRLSFANQFAGAPAQAATPPSFKVTGGGRPTGGNSAFDRAYDKAFTRTYLTKVDAEIRRTAGEVAEKYRDDPATMEKAFGALKGELKKNHIYPEIMADFDIGFDRLSSGYLEQARGRARDNQAKADLAQFRTDTENLATEQARKLAGFDPKDGVAADMIAADQAAIDAHFDQAAARGVIDLDDAQKAKSGFRRETALRYYEKQADAASADDVAAMRAEMAADFASGGLPGLDGEGWSDLDRKLAAMEKQKRGEANTAARKLRDRGDDMAGRLLQGVEINQGELTQLMLDSGNSAEGKAQMTETMAKISTGRAIRDLPLPEGRAYVEGLRKQYGDAPTESDARKLGFAEKSYLAKSKAIKDDPLTYAAQQSGQTVQPIDDTDANTLAQSMAARREQAINAARELGAPVSVFLPEEVKAMKAAVKTTDPQAFSQTMARFDEVAQMGGVEDVRRQFGDDAADAVQDWQGRLRYSSKEELAGWLKERADPKWTERVKPLASKGESEARKVEFQSLVQDFDDSWLSDPAAPVDGDTQRMFMNDFVQLAGERFASTQDAATARRQAVERMKSIWGVTSLFGERGGRLMAYPPEKFYPSIAGGQDWLGAQLAELAAQRNVEPEKLSLVADMRTKAAADRGELPGYLLSIIDPETGLDELAVDTKGSPLRVYFDTAKAAQDAKARATVAEDAKYDPWLVIGDDTFIGPFFPPWNPPTDSEMRRVRERAERIGGQKSKSRADRMAQKRQVRSILARQDQP